MHWRTIIGWAAVGTLFCAIAMWAAVAGSGSSDHAAVAASSQSASASVPPLIRFSAAATDFSSSTQNITFSLYGSAQSSTPLWSETQQVQIDDQSDYTVMLGSTRSEGLPLQLFTNGGALWLGVQIADEPEQPRTLMVAVPYAFKAADAETLSGLPASAFLLAPQAGSAPSGQIAGTLAPAPASSASLAASSDSGSGNTPPAANASNPVPATPCVGFTSDGTGTANQLVKFSAPCKTTKSAVTESGGKVGIGTTAPAGTLDVNGSALVRGTLQLPAKSTATTAAGFNSQPQDWQASAFSSATHAAQTQHFLWQAEPTGNNTAAPSGKLSLLSAAGATLPPETGLSIGSKGLITFAAGQKFPGTGPGTITGVMAGTDLSGGGTSGVVTLNLNTAMTDARYARLAAANSLTGNQSVTGNVTASGSVTGKQLVSTVANGTPPLLVSSTTQVANLNASLLGGMAASAFAKLGPNSFTGNQNIAGNLTVAATSGAAVTASSNAGNGGVFTGSSGAIALEGIKGFAGTTTTAGKAGPAGVFGQGANSTLSPASVGPGVQGLGGTATGAFSQGGAGLAGTGGDGLFVGGDGADVTGGNTAIGAIGGFGLNALGGNGPMGGVGAVVQGGMGSGGTNGIGLIAGGGSNSSVMSSPGADGIQATGGSGNNAGGAGNGITAKGGASDTKIGGNGIVATGGAGAGGGDFNGAGVRALGGVNNSLSSSIGGDGVFATGANGKNAAGGKGVNAFGGIGAAGTSGGDGVDARGGDTTGMSSGGLGVLAVGGNNGTAGGTGGDGIDAFAGLSTTNGLAGLFTGDVHVEGALNVSGKITAGTKDFKIEDPIDSTKYLFHASVESSEMKNIYDGTVVMDRKGEAVVMLPKWFEALNGDFRYQLTCIGGWAPVYIKQEIARNQFTIAGGNPGMKVSWQVTGVRHDAAAKAHPLVVEMAKSGDLFYRREVARAKFKAAAKRRAAAAAAIRPSAARPAT